MSERDTTFQAIPESETDPQIAAALEPGEKLYWQARPAKGKFPGKLILVIIIVAVLAWANGIRDLAAVAELLHQFSAEIKAFWQQLPWAFALFSLLPIGLIVAFWPRKERYALTDQRVFKLRSGKVRSEASPEKLMIDEGFGIATRIGKRSKVGNVRWANAETFEQLRKRDRERFAYVSFKVRDPDRVTRMLKDWRQQWLDARNREAEAAAATYRQALGESDTSAGNGQQAAPSQTAADGDNAEAGTRGRQQDASPTAKGIQRIVHPRHAFSIDVPSKWEIKVQHNYDGPLRVLGITLIKRIIRPGTPRSWKPKDNKPWNHMTLQGGTSVWLRIQINPGAGEAMPTEQEVLNDRWSKLLGASVQFFEKDLEINGFRGFAAVRELPAGANAFGFGEVGSDVISRQWWLTGHGLDLEIQGIAPGDSETQQQTLDLVVNSIRPRQ